ncbi:MAG: S1C family serine protease [Anaerolineae bacterium]
MLELRGVKKVISLALAAMLLLSGCIPLIAPEGSTAVGVETESVLQPISRVLHSKVGTVEDEAPALQATEGASDTEVAPSASEAEGLQETLTRLYRELNPAVVYIVVTSGSGNFPISSGGSGSGFVYSEEGYVITNNHVVDAGSSYEIVFATGDRARAELIGSDPDSDLAVLQVDELPNGVMPLPLGDSTSLEVGQLTVAIGSPFGEQGSMSLGIISGLGRSLPSQRMTNTGTTYSLPQVIQTDAPINPGNSGGPLLNLNGEVIGVNAAIASTTGVSSGVGFAIPVNVIKRVVPSLIEDGEVIYPYMGITFDGEVSLSDMELYGLSQTQGAYVISVTPGSPADEAGLVAADAETGRGGDLIVAIDGQPIQTFSDLNSYLVLETEVGQTLELTVLRGDERITLPLTLGARP